MTSSRCWPLLVAAMLVALTLVPATSAQSVQVLTDPADDQSIMGAPGPASLDVLGVSMESDGEDLTVTLSVTGPLDAQSRALLIAIGGGWSVFFKDRTGAEHSLRGRPFPTDPSQTTMNVELCSAGETVSTNEKLSGQDMDDGTIVWTLPVTESTNYDFRGTLTEPYAIAFQTRLTESPTGSPTSCSTDPTTGEVDRGPDDGTGLAFTTSELNPEISLSADEDSRAGPPGGSVSFDLSVANAGPGDANATFEADVPADWQAQITPTSALIAENDTAAVELDVAIPDGALPGDHPVTFRVLQDGKETASVELTVEVSEGAAEASFAVSASPTSASVTPGESTTYRLTVENTGNVDLELTLTLDGDNDWASLGRSTMDLPAGETDEVDVTVDVPSDAPEGSVAHTVTVTSGEDTKTSTLATTVTPGSGEGEATPGFGAFAALAAAGAAALLLGRRRRER